MKYWIIGIAILFGIFGKFVIIGSSNNLGYVRSHALEKWHEVGFEVIGSEGFQFGAWYGGSYGGAEVWYQLKTIPDNGTRYTGYLQDWGGELQVYGPHPVDNTNHAIRLIMLSDNQSLNSRRPH